MKTLLNIIKLSFILRTFVRYRKSYKTVVITGCPIHAVKTFKNGYGFSIIGGNYGQYGDGINTFEMAVLKDGNICYDTDITGDVLAYLDINETKNIITKIKAL